MAVSFLRLHSRPTFDTAVVLDPLQHPVEDIDAPDWRSVVGTLVSIHDLEWVKRGGGGGELYIVHQRPAQIRVRDIHTLLLCHGDQTEIHVVSCHLNRQGHPYILYSNSQCSPAQ